MKKRAFEKLKMDVAAYYQDNGLQGKFSIVKLILIVDFWPVFYYRLLEYCRERPSLIRQVIKSILVVFKPIVNGMSGARISPGATIGGGVLLHQSTGVLIASGTVIGENCTFFSGTCVVYKANSKGSGAPIIGDNVKLMVGCKVIGEVRVGNDTFVGANAVVVTDIPSYSIAVGVPAKSSPRRDDSGAKI